MAKGIKRSLYKAQDNVREHISGSNDGSKYSRGLSGEGYAGGYRDALSDVLLALNGVTPNNSRFWPNE